jgi:putative ABC transport system permease protein
MTAAWLSLRADLRQRWRAMLGLVLLIGVVSGVVLTAAAGARRTDTAYPRLLRWANASQVFVVPGEQGLATGGSGRTGFCAAVRRLPQVAAMSSTVLLGMAVVTGHGPPDPNANTAASLDGAAGRTVDRVRVLAGRQSDPADPDAVMIDQRMADLARVRPGGTLHVLGIRGFTSNTPDFKHAVPLALRVSGIVRFDDEVVPSSAGSAEPRALFTPAFARVYVHRYPWLATSDYAQIRLRPGASITSFSRAARALAVQYRQATRGTAAISSSDHAMAITQRAMRPDAVTLAAFAALAAVVALVVLAQLLSRQVALDATEFPILRALGASRSALAGTMVAVAAVVAAAVFGTSLLGLVSTPHRYGQNWTQKVDFTLPAAPGSLLAQVMAGQPGVRGYAQGVYGQVVVNRQAVPAIGVDPVRGHGFLTLLAGRLPTGPGEIALGQRTLRALHVSIGQQVRVSANDRAARRARRRHTQPRPAGRGAAPLP